MRFLSETFRGAFIFGLLTLAFLLALSHRKTWAGVDSMGCPVSIGTCPHSATPSPLPAPVTSTGSCTKTITGIIKSSTSPAAGCAVPLCLHGGTIVVQLTQRVPAGTTPAIYSSTPFSLQSRPPGNQTQTYVVSIGVPFAGRATWDVSLPQATQLYEWTSGAKAVTFKTAEARAAGPSWADHGTPRVAAAREMAGPRALAAARISRSAPSSPPTTLVSMPGLDEVEIRPGETRNVAFKIGNLSPEGVSAITGTIEEEAAPIGRGPHNMGHVLARSTSAFAPFDLGPDSFKTRYVGLTADPRATEGERFFYALKLQGKMADGRLATGVAHVTLVVKKHRCWFCWWK